jgi:hypothetical protein
MLHDPSHYEAPAMTEEIIVSSKDKDILQELAAKKAEIGTLSVQQEKARLWTALNDLKSERPMVWVNEICWNEMNVDDELTLRCEGNWAREQEQNLRKEMYQWNHLPGDMVVDPWIECQKAIHSTDFGIMEDTDVVKTDEENEIVSRHFNVQIEDIADLEKIQMPVVTHNEKATAFRMQAFNEVFDGIIPVKVVGQSHIWFTPWDFLIRWTGIENAMIGLYENPDLFHAAVERLVDAWMVELDQYENQKLLELDNNNSRVGSGGYGYISELPGADFDSSSVKASNMWGCSNAQIFSGVSPAMHWEFAVEHDMRWMNRWGVNYYGCCEPLHNKTDVLKKIPRLRKVSTSAWCDVEKIIENLGQDMVYSIKPSPAVLAGDNWNPEHAREEIRRVLDIGAGKAHMEFVMKDISTVGRDPRRLWDWTNIAMEEVTK